MLTTQAEELERAFIHHRAEVHAFLLRRTGNDVDAEELTQQVFADVAVALSRSAPPRSMRRWLFTVAERRFIDELRRRRRVAVVTDVPETVGDSHELPETLQEAVARLPQAQRQILVMRVLEGRTYRDIARTLGCAEAACKMRLSRALRSLRQQLIATS